MNRPWRTCPHPGCGQLTRGGSCPEHAGRGEHDVIYGRAWREESAAYRAEHPTCILCGAPVADVDHRTPVRMGGARLDRANLRSLCRACHVTITARTRATPGGK
jgi:5-methylcytosine-specific restriction enzyme A